MARKASFCLFAAGLLITVCLFPAAMTEEEQAAGLSVHYEELTAPQFLLAVEKSGGTCIIPLGIIEKHGAHLPLGTDLISCRERARQAAEREYTIVFPAYYFGQIFEARHQPGT